MDMTNTRTNTQDRTDIARQIADDIWHAWTEKEQQQATALLGIKGGFNAFDDAHADMFVTIIDAPIDEKLMAAGLGYDETGICACYQELRVLAGVADEYYAT